MVIDFGIARAAGHTTTHSVMAPPRSGSRAVRRARPHRCDGPVQLGQHHDLRGDGALRLPAGDTMPALMHAILTTEPDLSACRTNCARC
ncbi:hypothetical protein [Nonomuraea dietziae]|uniref:hypothetical protein n=1 Tax=Nonomuraea dietziae TaxID=65515 RepID=UPI0031DEC31E